MNIKSPKATILDFLIPTSRNNFSPKVFKVKTLALLTASIFLFNYSAIAFFPDTFTKVNAAGVNSSELVDLTNQARMDAKLNPLSTNQKLINAARAKAQDMFAKGYWAHFGPNGESPWQFIKEAGYSYIYAGENLAKGFTSSLNVHNAWMNSQAHRDNILRAEFKDIGIYVQSGSLAGEETILVVEMFGTPTSTTSGSPNVRPNVQAIIDKTPPGAPIILEPINNSYTNKDKFNIKGNAENKSEVTIYDNKIPLGKAISEGGAFDYSPSLNYPEGENTFEADSKDPANNISPKSIPVKVTIDKTSPFINTDNFIITKEIIVNNEFEFKISITDNYALKEIKYDQSEGIKDLKLSDGGYTGITSINNKNKITITATDMAGNVGIADLLPEEILKKVFEYKHQTQGGVNPNILEERNTIHLASFFNNLNIKQQVNLAIAVILILLLVYDAIKIHKMQDYIINRSKSLFNLMQIGFVLLLAAIGGFGSIV